MAALRATEAGAGAVSIAQALVRCPSITPAEGGALDVIERVLSAGGFRVDRPIFTEPGTPDVENLYARWGVGEPCLAFAGHTDVVPSGDRSRWTHPPFAGVIAEGELWGRGAVDMKGGIAAFLAAALDFVARRGGDPPGSIVLLITGDEEGPAINGTAKLLEWAASRGERLSHCILGEPTGAETPGDTIKIGRRGSLSGTLAVTGRQGHVAYPGLAHNPIPELVRLLSALLELRLDSGSAHFEPSNLEIVSVDVGNPAFNVIPAEARARFNVRFNDLHSLSGLEGRLREVLGAAASGRIPHRLDIEPGASEAFVTEPDWFVDLVARSAASVLGSRPALSTGGGTSDARFIRKYCPVVELGLVGRRMHQVDERSPLADIERLQMIYAEVLRAYFGESPA